MLAVDVQHAAGSFRLSAKFQTAGGLTALFGPSGSGKTTLVNLIAGLARPQYGRIAVDDRTLVDTEAGIFTPAHKRSVGCVFQDARLFPHMTVGQNLNYGRLFVPRAARYADPGKVIDLLAISHLLDRRPSHLSGGEKQRVALGRALIASPRIILMDEPLASLDDARKAEIMPFIERLRDDIRIPIVYVSHSIAEVARLATDVVILSEGKVKAYGPAGEIMQRLDLLPREEIGEAGALIDMVVADHDEQMGLSVLSSAAGLWRIGRVDAAIGEHVRVRVRARDVMIATEPPRGLSAINIVPGRISEIRSDDGSEAIVSIEIGGKETLVARITRYSLTAMALETGRPVYAIVKAVSFDSANVAAPPRAPSDQK